jgi:hypothetical protein
VKPLFVFLAACLPAFSYYCEFTFPERENGRGTFHAQVEGFLGRNYSAPSTGVGYRYHFNQFGIDGTVNARFDSGSEFIPTARAIALYYPAKTGMFVGGGIDAGPFTAGPMATFGYESIKREAYFLFVQCNGYYLAYNTATEPRLLASLSAGIGF